MKKSICHIVFSKFPTDDRVRRYCNILIKKNLKIYVICIKGKDEPSYEKLGDLRIIRLPVKKKRSSLYSRMMEYFIFEVSVFFKVLRLFWFKRVKLYHVHTLPDFLVFTTIIPKIFGSKVILDFHELFPEFMMQFKNLPAHSFIVQLLKLQEKLSFIYSDTIITFHDPAQNILKKRINLKKKIITIMNSVDPSEMNQANRKTNKYFNLIYNGTINPNLNLLIVIKAMKLIKERDFHIYSKIRFHLYGDGPDLKNILNLAEKLEIENVIFHGWLEFKEMYKELEKASALVLPPKKDIYSDLFYSGKLIECIYLKIPVISSRINTYMYYYPEECLNYFDANDTEQLATKILEVYNYPKSAEKKASIAFQKYQQVCWEVMEARYSNCIDELCNTF